MAKYLWPKVRFYSKQREIIRSVWENDRTVVPAGHMLGKDFVSAFIVLAFFLTRSPCRIITTSVDGYQLEGVLWGEIRNFIQTAAAPLTVEKGGPLIVNHMHIRKLVRGEACGLSYILGRVAEKGEGLSGHHIAKTGDGVPRTLAVADESSGVAQAILEKLPEWANRLLLIGNPYECQNDFRWDVDGDKYTGRVGGDLRRPSGIGFSRKVIRVTAEDSPNVQYALAEKAKGLSISNTIVLRGVLPYEDYLYRRQNWDPKKQAAGLDAQFYRGPEVMLFPPEWLASSGAIQRKEFKLRRYMGIDTAEGGDNTAFVVIDDDGIVDALSLKTPDTMVIVSRALAMMRKHKIDPKDVFFDRGGGGKQIADRLRQLKKPVRTVAFSESANPLVKKRSRVSKEGRTTYKNRRAEMYWAIREAMQSGFAIPHQYSDIHRQLSIIPLTYNDREQAEIIPKRQLVKILGRSPDEADALALAVFAKKCADVRSKVGVLSAG